eukprot:g2271.t1
MEPTSPHGPKLDKRERARIRRGIKKRTRKIQEGGETLFDPKADGSLKRINKILDDQNKDLEKIDKTSLLLNDYDTAQAIARGVSAQTDILGKRWGEVNLHEFTKAFKRRYLKDYPTGTVPSHQIGKNKRIRANANVEKLVDWGQMNVDTAHFFRRCPTTDLMRGTLFQEQGRRVRRQNRKRHKFDESEMIKPTQQDVNTQNREDEGVARIKKLHDKLRENAEEDFDTGDFWENVVNTHSFTKTVENLFDMSFLVKQKHVCITMEAGKNLPSYQLASGEIAQTQMAGVGSSQTGSLSQNDSGSDLVNGGNVQTIVSLNMEQFRRLSQLLPSTPVSDPSQLPEHDRPGSMTQVANPGSDVED